MTHHADCDGWRVDHRVTFERIRYSNGSISFRAVCEECGPLHVGSFGDENACKRTVAGHSRDVECDGRCHSWDVAA